MATCGAIALCTFSTVSVLATVNDLTILISSLEAPIFTYFPASAIQPDISVLNEARSFEFIVKVMVCD